MPEGSQKIAVIRIRGKVHVRGDIEDTLSMLNLTRKNHCVLLSKTPEYAGMIHKVNDHVTWGEVKTETILALLEKRGKTSGGRKLTDKEVKETLKFKSIKEFADALASGKASLKDVKKLKPVFSLSPPRGGFERGGIKKPYNKGGVLGYRGDEINKLIERML
jgi:large subunit ribosomal protein L30